MSWPGAFCVVTRGTPDWGWGLTWENLECLEGQLLASRAPSLWQMQHGLEPRSVTMQVPCWCPPCTSSFQEGQTQPKGKRMLFVSKFYSSGRRFPVWKFTIRTFCWAPWTPSPFISLVCSVWDDALGTCIFHPSPLSMVCSPGHGLDFSTHNPAQSFPSSGYPCTVQNCFFKKFI